MFDPGKGEGATFNWQLIKGIKREFFLAGGLIPENIEKAVETVQPFAVPAQSPCLKSVWTSLGDCWLISRSNRIEK